MLEKIARSLRARGFEAETVKSAAEACALVMKEAENARSVGWGGSETIKQIGARGLLLESGKDLPVATEISAEITDASIPNDWHFMLRWRRSAISNAAAMAIDNVSVTFTVQSRPLTIVVR